MGAETVNAVDFSNRAQLIAAGYAAGQRAIEQIRLAQNSNYKKRK